MTHSTSRTPITLEQIVGVWSVSAADEEPGAIATFSDQIIVWRMCGEITAPWQASPTGGFIASEGGESMTCVHKGQQFAPSWLLHAVTIQANDAGLELLDQEGAVLATLSPSVSPTPHADIIDSAAVPKLYPQMRMQFAAAAPHALPVGWKPAKAGDLIGLWSTDWKSRSSEPALSTPYVRFESSGSFSANVDCNGGGGRWGSSAAGELLTVTGAQTLIGCGAYDASRPRLDEWLRKSSGIGLKGEVLGFFDASGALVGQVHRSLSGDFAAVWPEVVVGSTEETFKPWRKDARQTASHFATAVLGWKSPRLTQITPSNLAPGELAYDARPAPGGHSIELRLKHVYDLEQWSVTYLWGFGKAEHASSVRVDAGIVEVHFSFAQAGLTPELRVASGPNLLKKSSTSGADWKLSTDWFPEGSGSIMVLFRNANGEAVTGWGTPLPAGPFAAS